MSTKTLLQHLFLRSRFTESGNHWHFPPPRAHPLMPADRCAALINFPRPVRVPYLSSLPPCAPVCIPHILVAIFLIVIFSSYARRSVSISFPAPFLVAVPLALALALTLTLPIPSWSPSSPSSSVPNILPSHNSRLHIPPPLRQNQQAQANFLSYSQGLLQVPSFGGA